MHLLLFIVLEKRASVRFFAQSNLNRMTTITIIIIMTINNNNEWN